MKNQTFLVLLSPDYDEAELSPFLDHAAEESAHVAFQVVQAAPRFPTASFAVYPYGSVAVPENWNEIHTKSADLVDAACRELETLLSKHDTSGDVTAVYAEIGRIGELVARRAMLCDRAYISRSLAKNAETLDVVQRGVLYNSPAGLMINALSSQAPLSSDTVLIAWDNGLSSARAVKAALPILLEAKQVYVAVFDPEMTEYADGQNPGSDIAKWLSHYGCKVAVQQYPSGGREIGVCIRERADELGADLVVMGAFGHARLLQVVFGGTTATLLEQKALPVLLAH